MDHDARTKQLAYYSRTSSSYHEAHVQPGDEHYIALEYAVGLMRMLACSSVLDVGAGTGRAMAFMRTRLPDLEVNGVEPSAELRALGCQLGLDIRDGVGEKLPFADRSVDAVIATGVMHHVAEPSVLIAEMLRVARTLVVISDSNRFGQGSSRSRFAKIVIHKIGAWPLFEWARTRGRGYMESDGDGIFYSYSVHDSRDQLALWADRVFTIPTTPARSNIFGSLGESTHALIAAIREPGVGWAGLPN